MLMNVWFSMQMQDNKAQDMHAKHHHKNHLSNAPRLKYLLVLKQNKNHTNKMNVQLPNMLLIIGFYMQMQHNKA